jgi:hypothetical protein
MAILYSYPQATPDLVDLVLGSKFINGEGLVTKSFSISEIANLIQHVERPYEVYTALLTQSGGSNILPGYGDETFTIGVTYTIVTNPDNYDLTIYGAPNNNVGTSFVSNQTTVLPYTTSLEFEYDTGAPVAIVLENTIGNIWFSYDNVGNYIIFSNNLFTSNIATFIGGLEGYVGSGGGSPLGGGTGIARLSNSALNFSVLDTSTLPQNDSISGYPIEIRVYN